MRTSNMTRITTGKESRLAFGAAVAAGIVAHAYRMLNFLPGADGIEHLMGTTNGIAEGNFLFPLVGWMTSTFNLSWVNGVLSILYLAVSAVLLVDLLELVDTFQILLTAILWVGFPAVTSAFAYMSGADVFMLSGLFSVASLWILKKGRSFAKYPVAVVFMFLGIGIFHVSIGMILALILLLTISQVLNGEPQREVLGSFGKMLGCFVISIAGYLIVLVMAAKVRGRQLAVRFGVIPPREALGKTISDMEELHRVLSGGSLKIYGWCVWGIIILTLCLAVFQVIYRKMYRKPLIALVYVLSIALLPFCAFALNFLEKDMAYETYMELAAVIPFFVLILLWKASSAAVKNIPLQKTITVVCGLVMGITCFADIVSSNVNYFYMTLSYEKTYANCLDLLNRMDDCDSFDRGCTVAVFGTYDSLDFLATESVPVSGITPKVFLEDQDQYVTFWANACGIRMNGATEEQRVSIADTDAYKEMAAYPAYGCVQEINGIIVVKLSE